MKTAKITAKRPQSLDYQIVSGRMHRVHHQELVDFTGTVSMTEPNQVVDLRTLLVQKGRGVHPVYFNGAYSEHDTEDIQKMDFVELAALRERVQERVEALKKDHHGLTVQLEALREEAYKKRLDDLIAKREVSTEQPEAASHNSP